MAASYPQSNYAKKKSYHCNLLVASLKKQCEKNVWGYGL